VNRYVLPLYRIPLPGERLLHHMKPVEVTRFDHYLGSVFGWGGCFTGPDTAVMEIRYLAADEDEPLTAKVVASRLCEELFGETLSYSGPLR